MFILYGLRRTGKTTLIRQIFDEMTDEELAKAAFVQITGNDTLAAVNQDPKLWRKQDSAMSSSMKSRSWKVSSAAQRSFPTCTQPAA